PVAPPPHLTAEGRHCFVELAVPHVASSTPRYEPHKPAGWGNETKSFTIPRQPLHWVSLTWSQPPAAQVSSAVR
ncbi:MAG: hypothetical protein O2968_16135, partial [Acidobacteria bacterium]|nr:hypothetical protein [Acidobacteriota bacterium]